MNDTWPIGTCHFSDLPMSVQIGMSAYIENGIVSDALELHRTPTEGPYVNFSGWKIRVRVEDVSPTTYIVRLA